MKTHTEDAFEKLIVEHLVLHGGFEPRGQTTYDPDEALAVHAGYDVHRALIPAEVIAFVQATQPKPWAKLQAIHGSALEGIFLDALCKVWMTTRLAKGSTRFLPFNRGHDQGAGNPPVEGRHRTCYLWEQVWQRDSLLDLVGRFVHLQEERRTDPNTGKTTTTETMIFPRYHQMDCVRRLVSTAREQGTGTNYLVQHSAGSGKSNSIAWLAHRLASLHDEQDHKV